MIISKYSEVHLLIQAIITVVSEDKVTLQTQTHWDINYFNRWSQTC